MALRLCNPISSIEQSLITARATERWRRYEAGLTNGLRLRGGRCQSVPFSFALPGGDTLGALLIRKTLAKPGIELPLNNPSVDRIS
jgi:hypothetical protein